MTEIQWDSTDSTPQGSSPAGEAGNEILSALSEGPGSRAAAEKMRNAGDNLKSLAQKGSFAVNEAGFQAYIKACDFFIDEYSKMASDLRLLTQNAKMGSSEYSLAVADFNTTVAASKPDSMLPNLELMLHAIKTAREAMVLARKNYRENENHNSVSFDELSRKLDDQ